MTGDEMRASATAVAAELIVVAGQGDLKEVRAAVVDSIIGARMFPFGTDATIKEAMEHAGMVLRMVTLTLGDAIAELEGRDV